MTSQELDELEKLCDGATPGEWSWKNIEGDDTVLYANTTRSFFGILNAIAVEGADATETDKALLAASRTAVPQLIAEVRRLTDALSKAEKCIYDTETYMDMGSGKYAYKQIKDYQAHKGGPQPATDEPNT
jgi:hypothetical protein